MMPAEERMNSDRRVRAGPWALLSRESAMLRAAVGSGSPAASSAVALEGGAGGWGLGRVAVMEHRTDIHEDKDL